MPFKRRSINTELKWICYIYVNQNPNERINSVKISIINKTFEKKFRHEIKPSGQWRWFHVVMKRSHLIFKIPSENSVSVQEGDFELKTIQIIQIITYTSAQNTKCTG